MGIILVPKFYSYALKMMAHTSYFIGLKEFKFSGGGRRKMCSFGDQQGRLSPSKGRHLGGDEVSQKRDWRIETTRNTSWDSPWAFINQHGFVPFRAVL